MRLATESEMARWDDMIVSNPDGGRPEQSRAWGELKMRLGWQPEYYVYEMIGGKTVAALWLIKKLPLLGEYWYCPGGPGVVSFGDLRQIVEQTKSAELGAAWIRFEAPMPAVGVPESDLANLGIVRANQDLADPSELFLNLSEYDFPDKAAKLGLAIEPAVSDDRDLVAMYELMQIAATADESKKMRPRDYYLDYWKQMITGDHGRLFFVRYQGERVGGVFVSILGRRARSHEVALTDRVPKKRADLLIHCEIMRWLQQHGAVEYSLPLELAADFGLAPTLLIGTRDLPVSSFKYKIWRLLGERILGRLAARGPEKSFY
jgi:hypothetical protein